MQLTTTWFESSFRVTCSLLLIVTASLSAPSRSAHARLTLNDGANHTISSLLVSESIAISNGTQVTITTTGGLDTDYIFDNESVLISDTSQLFTSGVIEVHRGRRPAAIRAMGNSQTTVSGGRVEVSGSIDQFRTGIKATDQATVIVNDGDIISGGSGGSANRIVNRTAISAEGHSQVEINGGRLIAGGSATPGGTRRIGLHAQDHADVSIFGGQFLVGSSTDQPPLDILAEGNSVVRIFGSDFNYPYGEIEALEGSVTGKLHNGITETLVFQRTPNATIILAVPEPSAYVLAMLALLTGISRRITYR